MRRITSTLLSLALIFCMVGCGKKAPTYETLNWPVNELCGMLPAPKSDKGKVNVAYDHAVSIDVAETSEQDFKDYTKLCEEQYGFSEDTSHSDQSFVGYTADGYHLIVQLHPDNVMWVNLEIPKAEEPSPEPEPEESEPAKEPELDISPSVEPSVEPATTEPSEPPVEPPVEQPSEEPAQKPEETQKPDGQSVIYSTNSFEQAKSGNSGVFAYRHDDKNYDTYWIIDFDEGFAYTFTLGNSSETCDKIEITSGDLNNYILVTYHDGGDSWEEGLRFKRKRQPDRMVWMDGNGLEVEFIGTSLTEALELRDGRTIIEY